MAAAGETERAPVVVIGSTSTVVRLADELERSGEDVRVLVTEPASAEVIAELAEAGADVTVTGAIRPSALRQAGVAGAKSVVVCGADDVHALRIALMADELNPAAHLVVEMSTPALGEQLTSLLGDCQVLSSAELAAPSFVSATLATEDTLSFELGGRLVVAGPAERVGGDRLAEIADTRRRGEDQLLPDRGDVILGTELISPARPLVRTSGWRGVIAHVLGRRARWVLLGVLVLILISAAYFRLTGLDWLTAVFLALTTSTATGLGDLDELGVGWRIGAVVIAFFGLLLSAGVTAVIIDALISVRLSSVGSSVGGRPHDHVLVCGLGRIGSSVALRLHARGVAVVAIERDENAFGVARVRRARIPVIIDEAGDRVALDAAGIERAAAVLAVTDDDGANLQVALAARQAHPDVRLVTRMFDHDLANRVEHRLGLGTTRSVSMLAAPAFAAAALGRRTEVVFPIGRRVLLFTEVGVGPRAACVGRPLNTLESPGSVRVLAVRPDGGSWDWRPADHPAAPGDRIALVASRSGLARTLLATRAPREPS